MRSNNSAGRQLTLYQAASLMGLPPATVYHLALAGVIPFERVGQGIQINLDQSDAEKGVPVGVRSLLAAVKGAK